MRIRLIAASAVVMLAAACGADNDAPDTYTDSAVGGTNPSTAPQNPVTDPNYDPNTGMLGDGVDTNQGGALDATDDQREANIRNQIEAAGYSGVTNMTRAPDGGWYAQATQDGRTVRVHADTDGSVSVVE
jgi:hypothetical protein